MNEEIIKLREKVPESGTKEMDKTIFRIYHVFDENEIEYGSLINYIYDISKYEIYIFLSNKDIAVPCIGLYYTENKDEAIEKFEEYKNLVNLKNIEILKSLVK